MDRRYVYHGSYALLGAAVGLDAFVSAATGGLSLPVGLMALGATAMLLIALYEVLTSDSSEFAVPAYAVFGLILAALLAFLGAVLQVAEYVA
ncbi:hypothetical protein [Halorussus sp. AFM4]|uniref:hypothetical protein n=1 Tax=Halorussus sp. AFM4 TaxID=3421651 RepID=UPI003EB84BB5